MSPVYRVEMVSRKLSKRHDDAFSNSLLAVLTLLTPEVADGIVEPKQFLVYLWERLREAIVRIRLVLKL